MTGVKAKAGATVKVSIEVMSWLKEDFGHEGWDRLAFEEEVAAGSSIMELLQKLAGKYPRFKQKAFVDSKNDLLNYCAVVFNGTFLSSLQDLNKGLKQGDNIKLTPGFYGG